MNTTEDTNPTYAPPVKTLASATEAPIESEVTEVSPAESKVARRAAKNGSSFGKPTYLMNPEDSEPPTMGIPKIRQSIEDRLALRSGREPNLVKPNRPEAHQRQLRRIGRKKQEVNALSMGRKRIFAVFNSKGGAGKTPLIGYLCNIQMDITRMPTLCVDANQNAGTTHDWFGDISSETHLQLRDAVANRHVLTSYSAVAEYSFKHDSGVVLVCSDTQSAGKPVMTTASFTEAASIWNEAFPSLYFDVGNGFNDVSTIGTMMVANAPLFLALVEKPSSFEQLIRTMITYQDMGFDEKVKNGFIVISGTKPGDTPRMYVQLLAEKLKSYSKKDVLNTQTGFTSDVERSLDDLGITEDRIRLIPFSPYIKQENVISVDMNVIGLDTYEAYLDLLISVYRQNANYPPMKLKMVPASPSAPGQPQLEPEPLLRRARNSDNPPQAASS